MRTGVFHLRLDGERRGVVEQQTLLAGRLDRAIAPDGRRWQTRRQDLLRDLPHGNLVVINFLAALLLDRPGPRHHRWDQQRCRIFGNSKWIQCTAGDLGKQSGADPPLLDTYRANAPAAVSLKKIAVSA